MEIASTLNPSFQPIPAQIGTIRENILCIPMIHYFANNASPFHKLKLFSIAGEDFNPFDLKIKSKNLEHKSFTYNLINSSIILTTLSFMSRSETEKILTVFMAQLRAGRLKLEQKSLKGRQAS